MDWQNKVVGTGLLFTIAGIAVVIVSSVSKIYEYLGWFGIGLLLAVIGVVLIMIGIPEPDHRGTQHRY